MRKKSRIFIPGGERERVLRELWPTTMSWQDILKILNAIPGEKPVKSGTMRIQAQLLMLRRPGIGRYWREIALGKEGT